MNWYPQIGPGSIAQFPVTRSRKWRAIVNQMEDGEQIMLPDMTAGQIQWTLSYQDLTSAEVESLSALFNASQGQFGAFTFVDPMANLLEWSESLAQPGWQPGLLQVTAGAPDPLGTTRASTLVNATAAAQSLTQTVNISGNYVACFSAYLSSSVAGAVTLQRDAQQLTVSVGPQWRRVYISGAGTSGAAQSNFSIGLAAGQTINVWGMQVEVQPFPSSYKQTSVALGIYPQTYFGIDELKITSTSTSLSSCQIILISQA